LSTIRQFKDSNPEETSILVVDFHHDNAKHIAKQTLWN